MIWLAVALAALLVLCAAGVTAAAFLPDMPSPGTRNRLRSCRNSVTCNHAAGSGPVRLPKRPYHAHTHPI
jgi:hypothetical protein